MFTKMLLTGLFTVLGGIGISYTATLLNGSTEDFVTGAFAAVGLVCMYYQCLYLVWRNR